MGRTLKYYPSSGFLPSVVSAAFFGKTCNELISCDKGSFSASQSLARMGRTLSTTHPGYFHVETKPNPF